MRKPVVIVLAALAVMLLGATAVLTYKYQKTTKDLATVQADREATNDRYANAINEIAVIQDSLNAIALGDSAAALLPTQFESERRMTQSQSDAALARIGTIKAGIERTKDRISQLDANLKQSGIEMKGLRRMIANLRKDVAEKEAYAAELTSRVDSLQTTVNGLVAEVQHSDQTIEAQRREMGTIYYVIGTRKDLTTSGVVEATGGFLGLGKTLKPAGTVNVDAFTAMDTDAENVIRIPATRAQVVSDQPASSYALELVGDQLELHILDAQRFRTVKHLVIVTA